MGSEATDPLRLLQEELKDDDYEQVIQSINRLRIVAKSLGPERTRTELIPFLLEFSEQDNDEAHAAVARQLGDFVGYLGGPAQAVAVLPLLEKLCAEEEVVVRDAAVASLVQLVSQLKKDDVISKFVPLIKRLGTNSWFATRVSACGLIGPTYGVLSDKEGDIRTELRSIFAALCGDETPMVRKAAYLNLGEVAAKLGKTYFKTDILPVLKALSSDPSDNMRVLILEILNALGDVLEPSEYEINILPIIEALEDDTSWRVRQVLAKQLPALCKNVTATVAQSKMLPLFVKLLKDKDAEVRQGAASVLAEIGSEVKSSDILLGGPLELLAADPIQTVRISLAKALLQLARRFPKESGQKVVIPLLKQLTKDESLEVRSAVLQEIDKLAEIDPQILLSIVPLLIDLGKDAKWRVRGAVVDKSAFLAKHMGTKKFEKQLQPLLIATLSDHVYAIRDKACVQVGLIVQLFGCKWAAEKLFPAVFSLYDKNANYLHRMTCLQLIQSTVAHCTPDIIEKHLLPLVLVASTDEVANVRISAAKTLGSLIPRVDAKLSVSKIHPALKKLSSDTDGDVSYFATQSLTVKLPTVTPTGPPTPVSPPTPPST